MTASCLGQAHLYGFHDPVGFGQYLDDPLIVFHVVEALHSLVVAMSPKPSVTQSQQNGPRALTGDREPPMFIKTIGETEATGRVVNIYAEMRINRLFLIHAAEKDAGTLRKFGGIGTG